MNPQNIENKNFNFKNPEKLLDEKENLTNFESVNIEKIEFLFNENFKNPEKICSKLNNVFTNLLKEKWINFNTTFNSLENSIWNTEIV